MEDAAFDRFTAVLNDSMFVLTVPGRGDDRPSGCLVGFATQCSMSPIRFLICVSKNNHTFAAMTGAEFVGVHVLGDDNRDLAELFGTETGDKVDKFTRCQWSAGQGGVPILADCASWFIGRVDTGVDFGDHVGFLLDPVQVAAESHGQPLMSSALHDLQAGHEA